MNRFYPALECESRSDRRCHVSSLYLPNNSVAASEDGRVIEAMAKIVLKWYWQ